MNAYDTFHVVRDSDGGKKWLAAALSCDDLFTIGIGDNERAALKDLKSQVEVPVRRARASERRELWWLCRARAARTSGVRLVGVQ
jgi:hypothetical protein